MPFLRAAQTRNSFLSFSAQHGVVIHTPDQRLVQKWEIENSPEVGYVFLKDAQNSKRFLISPNEQEAQILLGALNEGSIDFAKWKMVQVTDRYVQHPIAPNYANHIFIMSRVIPIRTGRDQKMKEHGMDVKGGQTRENAPVILWQHRGIHYPQRLNQMWIVRNEI